MTSINVIYNIPSIKHTFFLTSSLYDISNSSQAFQDSEKRKKCFENILKSKKNGSKNLENDWKYVLIEKNEFLQVLKACFSEWKIPSNLSYNCPEHLELLAINLLNFPDQLTMFPEDSTKILSCIPDEDVIEVFI